MASIFPANPSIGDVYGSYRWDGTAWVVIGVDFTTDYATYTQLTNHEADSTNVHAITDTTALETQTGAQTKANNAANSALSTANSYTDTKVITAVPSQTGNSGKFLTTNGSATSWGTVDLTTKANLASPTFTGTPAVPTASFGDNTTQIASTAFVQDAVKLLPINYKTASLTLSSSEVGKLLMIESSSANTVTVPPDSTLTLPIGTQIPIVQWGTGQTTVAFTSPAWVAATPGLKLRTQYSSAMLIKIAANAWLLSGDIVA